MNTATTRKFSSAAAREADELIQQEMKDHKCSRSEAASRVFKANPALRERMLNEANR